MKIATILDQIDLGAMALPEFQRGFVWNRDQVRALMHSLYRKYPVGSLLIWMTKTEEADTRGDGELQPGTVKLLLDGQQRITSLYGIIRGKPPQFFDSNAQAFTGLYFNLADEVFEFYAPAKMKDDPQWISVSELMKTGAGEAIRQLATNPDLAPCLTEYIERVNAIDQIKYIDLHIEEVAGEDKTVEVVVDIFNRVNSGGTKLSKGDLALAKICAQWPEARKEMKKRLEKWRRAGFNFRLDWLLRIINVIVTGEATFGALKDVKTEQIKTGLVRAEKGVDVILNMISGRLGLDHDRVLGSRYSIPLMARYLDQRGGKLSEAGERDRLLFWYIHTFLWGRYSVSTETILNRDLEAIEGVGPKDQGDGIDQLIGLLRQDRGDLTLNESDFGGNSKGSRFYPLLYMMTRVNHARDWGTGDELRHSLLGSSMVLHVHHLFPKALLYEHGYSRKQVNAIANFTFLTQETNLEVWRRDPAEYIPHYLDRYPGAIESHWLPMDPNLWKVQNYPDFLSERRRLLAKSANDFLDKLLTGVIPSTEVAEGPAEAISAVIPGTIESEEEEALLRDCNEWVVRQGLPEGQMSYELVDPEADEPWANLDLAWPDGLQEGLGLPVAVLIGEGDEVEELVEQAGFHFFTDVERFKEYVRREVLALEPAQ